MSTNIQNMEMMHYMCQREVKKLQSNLTHYLLESARLMDFISGCTAGDDHLSAGSQQHYPDIYYNLVAYDNYMSNLEMVNDLARKFNLHLQLKTLNKAVRNCVSIESPERNFDQYLRWNMRCEQHTKDYESKLASKTDDCAENDEKTIKLPIEPLHAPLEPVPAVVSTVRKVHFSSPTKLQAPKQLLQKNLAEFILHHEFQAIVTYIKDYERLAFYVCELHSVLFELSSMFHLQQLSQPPNDGNVVFGLSMNKDSILRAVIVASSNGNHAEALLIDFGEIVMIDDDCLLYEIPLRYQAVPAQAIKCVLLAICENDVAQRCDRQEMSNMLRSKEFKTCTFRVLHKVERVLHVALLLTKEEMSPPRQKKLQNLMPAGSEPTSPQNPFLFTDDGDGNEFSNYNESQAADAIPIAALPKSIISLPKAKNLHNNSLSPTKIDATSVVDDETMLIVTATYVADVEYFYGQIEPNYPQLHREPLIWNEDEVTPQQRLVLAPQLNELILAKYNKDGLWYRAQVLNIDEEKNLYKVFYVDYGNNEIVPLGSMAQCLCLPTTEPFRAVRLRLAGISSITGTDEMRHQQALNALCVIILNQTFAVKILQRSEVELLVRIIDEQFSDVTNMLISMGYAKQI